MEERTQSGSHIYNCHGLVFASRRTRITEAATVRAILGYDSYDRVAIHDALPGDIALYIKYPEGEIDHSAVVIERADQRDLLPSPKVFSKWGFWLEVIHLAQACPYAQEPGVAIEYYRCRL